jgi:hypothetical protein
MREIFIGKPVHWLLWLAAIPALYLAGMERLHVRHFNLFLLLLGVLGLGAVLFVRWTARSGEAITRESIAEGTFQQGTIDE